MGKLSLFQWNEKENTRFCWIDGMCVRHTPLTNLSMCCARESMQAFKRMSSAGEQDERWRWIGNAEWIEMQRGIPDSCDCVCVCVCARVLWCVSNRGIWAWMYVEMKYGIIHGEAGVAMQPRAPESPPQTDTSSTTEKWWMGKKQHGSERAQEHAYQMPDLLVHLLAQRTATLLRASVREWMLGKRTWNTVKITEWECCAAFSVTIRSTTRLCFEDERTFFVSSSFYSFPILHHHHLLFLSWSSYRYFCSPQSPTNSGFSVFCLYVYTFCNLFTFVLFGPYLCLYFSVNTHAYLSMTVVVMMTMKLLLLLLPKQLYLFMAIDGFLFYFTDRTNYLEWKHIVLISF